MSSNEDPGSHDLSADVRTLLFEHIESYEQLEILLLLQRNRGADWTAAQLSGHLKISDELVAESLSALQMGGLVLGRRERAPIAYAYAPVSLALEETVSRLAAAYSERPVPIIRLMSSNAIQRLRTGAMRALAESFVLGRGKNRG
ncbi:MAG TPA: hypothetical protein VHY36_01760 [Steroidobacteraceae bacterium]|jgi:hypothetical protein|nr:hypothetical protein [Steroidobacteraceae bacterium]